MALTQNHPNNELIKFRTDVAFDFARGSRLDSLMGDTAMSPIVRMADLSADGKEIRIPLVNQLSGDGVGVGTLSGNEEQLDSYGMPMWADWCRNAVANNRAANKESSFSVRSTARTAIRNWAKRVLRDDMIDMLLSIPTSTISATRGVGAGNRVNGIKWSAATAANKNAWTAANYDRVVFGKLIANYSATFATAVGNVDSTDDKMSVAIGSLMKAQAQQSGVDPNNPGVYNGRPKITPWMIEGENNDQEWYVCLLGTRAFRDLKNDAVMVAANREARPREGDPTKTNPIFTGGAMIYDGIVYREVPEITQRLLLKSVGNGSIDVEPVFLLGQGAYGYVTGQAPRVTQKEDTDYDFITGVGIEAQYGVGKIAKAPIAAGGSATVGTLVDWGVVTGFVSGVANG